MKKILAIALALVMIMSLAVFASAAETTLPDSNGTGWWVNHTEGIPVTEEGFTATFTATAHEGAVDNWHAPYIVLYGGSEAKVNGEGYNEYWVHRADNYGWAGGWGNFVNTSDMAAVNALGVTVEATFAAGCWDNWVADMKAGQECVVTAKLEGTNAVVSITVHGVTNTVTVPVDAANPIYLSLAGDTCTLTNIVVTTPDAPAEPVAVEDGKYVIACGDLTFAALAEDKGYGYPVAGSASALTDADYVTITNVADGQFTMQDCFGRYIYMKGSYNSFNVSAEMPTEGYLWVLEETEGGLMLKNVEKEKYLAYSEQYSSWGCYAEVTANFVLTVTAAEEPDINQPTGDAIFAVLAIFAASGMGLTAVVSKKR